MIVEESHIKGLKMITDEDLEKMRSLGIHDFRLERRIIKYHLGLDSFLSWMSDHKPVHLYTGIGPSGDLHLGHCIGYEAVRSLQNSIPDLLFMISDDEKYLRNSEKSFQDIQHILKQNYRLLKGFGFDSERTKYLTTSENIEMTYRTAIRVAKHLTINNVLGAFGGTLSTNIGEVFYTAIQIAPCFFRTDKDEMSMCLVICGEDQVPYFHLARDIAHRLGAPKPAVLVLPTLMSLNDPTKKMSSSVPNSGIYLEESKERIHDTISRAITTGGATIELHRKYGGVPQKCPVFKTFEYVVEPDTEKLEKRRRVCQGGTLSCQECKQNLETKTYEYIAKFET